MLFPSVGGYMIKNTEAHQFCDRSYGSYMIQYSRPILIKLNSKFRTN